MWFLLRLKVQKYDWITDNVYQGSGDDFGLKMDFAFGNWSLSPFVILIRTLEAADSIYSLVLNILGDYQDTLPYGNWVIDWLIDFNDISTNLMLFYTKRLGNRFHWTVI